MSTVICGVFSRVLVKPIEFIKQELRASPKVWLVTGVAGFIGSNLLERLLVLDQTVVGLDNFFTGKRKNISEVKSLVTHSQWQRFTLIEGDIRDPSTCAKASEGTDFVLHQAAIGSVPRSMEDPLLSNEVNVCGTLNMLLAARDRRVRRFVYASSSSVYGDCVEIPQSEGTIGRPLSPYAASKYTGELYAGVFSSAFGLETIGLRYFNVFGPRQDPDGVYAAVIPRWISAMIRGEPCFINGSGETSRDFCYVENVIQANLLAAVTDNPDAPGQAYNVAVSEQTSLNQLFRALYSRLSVHCTHLLNYEPVYRDFRPGDVMHSLACIDKARDLLGYSPTHGIQAGLDASLDWYRTNLS